MYVVISGQILARRLDGEMPFFLIGPGQVIREAALLRGGIRSTDFVAASDVQLASLSRQILASLMKATREFAARPAIQSRQAAVIEANLRQSECG